MTKKMRDPMTDPPTTWMPVEERALLPASAPPTPQEQAAQRAAFEERQQAEMERIAFWDGSPPEEMAPWGVIVSHDATGTKHYEAWAEASCAAYGTQDEQQKRFSQKRIACDEADPPNPNKGNKGPAGWMPMLQSDRDVMIGQVARVRERMNESTHASPSQIKAIARKLRDEANALSKQWERERAAWLAEEVLNDAARLRVEDRIREYQVMTSEQRKIVRELLVSRD